MDKLTDEQKKVAIETLRLFKKYLLKEETVVDVIESLLTSEKKAVISELRDKFFKECTNQTGFNGLPKVNIAPHDLFEWTGKIISRVFDYGFCGTKHFDSTDIL